ncbi:chaperone protein dnaJ 20, chloroplastic-like [Zingiber officinale]|uniref:J domain-containing protein n=1 Tax=Zingiber officinale TaxID=94328 RepID=A0A8J5FXB2_ZINOF|nr:chaperone protein dnaJ 20, chloroplastic-like [Zingiber officinale]KAG6492207.1 hypothetical protein ZIOFF_047157 [Zingiber officinale]
MAAFALSSPSNSLYRSSFSPIPTKTAPAPRFRVSASAAAVVNAPAAPATIYDLLSVSHTAGASEIRAAYRRLALRWHPDACRSAGEERFYAERFIEAREAYEVLSDPAAVGAGPAFREGHGRRREASVTVFGNWDAQLDGLRRRSTVTEADGEETWGGRVRRATRGAAETAV